MSKQANDVINRFLNFFENLYFQQEMEILINYYILYLEILLLLNNTYH
jgi:hypothetical protein